MLPRSFYQGGDRNGLAFLPTNPSDPCDRWIDDEVIDNNTTHSLRIWVSENLTVLVNGFADFFRRALAQFT
jgi:hypothetical protein